MLARGALFRLKGGRGSKPAPGPRRLVNVTFRYAERLGIIHSGAFRVPTMKARNSCSTHCAYAAMESWVEMATWKCIYKLEGDVLTVCMSRGDTVPGEFSAKAGSNCIVTTLKKVQNR